MKFVNELQVRESMDDTNIHASVISGKVRISSFTYTATEADTQLTIAYLPAGRGRALPVLCRYQTNNITGTVKIGTGAYTDAMPGVGTVAAVEDNITSATAANNATQSCTGAVEGIPYHSLEDIPIILTAASIPVGATVKGIFVYNVT